MAKFSGSKTRRVRTNLQSPVKTTQPSVTFEGAGAFSRDPESDLFLLAATNFVGEGTFYESAQVRDERFLNLIRGVTRTNPDFIAGSDPAAGKIGLAEFLRTELFMRSASIVLAAEYVAAGGPNGRSVVARSLGRPDEPAELLAYWMTTHGRAIPNPIKRGIADALARLYTEKNLIKYDGQSKNIRFADVIELTHPRSGKDRPWQSALFRYALDRRHLGTRPIEEYGRNEDGGLLLSLIAEDEKLLAIPTEERRQYLRDHTDALDVAGWPWERLSGWLPGGMDAEAWEFVLPYMGVGALLKNLRNFDQAGISSAAIDSVISRITDPELVGRARLFPYQVWAAYRYAPSDNWKRALGTTLTLASRNIPSDLDGTLAVVDCSGSMKQTVSDRSQMSRTEVAAVFAATLVTGTNNSDLVIFGDTNKKLNIPKGTSALQVVNTVLKAVNSNEVGSSTFGHTAIRDHYEPTRHKRVILATDDQMWDSVGGDSYAYSTYGMRSNRGPVDISYVPLIYTCNLAGYAPSSLAAGEKGRHTLGGFSDATFKLMRVLEMSKNADWPF